MNCRDLSCEQCTVGDPEGAPILRLVGVDKIPDGKKVLDNIDLDIPRNRITAIIGLLKPDRGQVLLDGVDLGDFSREELFETRRRFGMLFQSGALFDSLDVFGNVAFPLREKTKLGEEQIRERVQVILRKVGLERAGEKFPDEPTTGLDPIIRNSILNLICRTFHDHKFTMVMISHDIPDIFHWCHHVVVMHEGKVIEAGAPKDVRNSVNPFVRQLVQGDIHGPIQRM